MSAFDHTAFYLGNIAPPDIESIAPRSPAFDQSMTVSKDSLKRSNTMDFLASTPTSVTRLLTITAPFVTLISRFIQLVQWNSGNPAESMLLVFAWWGFCLYARQVIVYGITWILVGWILWNWVQRGRRESLGKPHPVSTAAPTQHDLNETVAEIQRIVDQLTVCHWWWRVLAARVDWSDPSETKLAIIGIIYAYPAWIIVNWLVPLNKIFLVLGTFALIWASPWMVVIRWALGRSELLVAAYRIVISFAISIVTLTFRGNRVSDGGDKKGFSVRGLWRRAREQQEQLRQRAERKEKELAEGSAGAGTNTKAEDLIFRFVIYENQRWWFGLDWTSNLLPSERPPWGDEFNEPTPPKSKFTLPPPTYTITPHSTDPSLLVRKTMEWTWVDPDWWVDLDGDVDREGFEYGDNRWKQMRGQARLGAYTRRRKWVRAARLVEKMEVINNETSSSKLTVPRSSDRRSRSNSSSSSEPMLQMVDIDEANSGDDAISSELSASEEDDKVGTSPGHVKSASAFVPRASSSTPVKSLTMRKGSKYKEGF